MTDTITLLRSVIEDTIHALERYAVKRQDFERFESELTMLKAALAAPQPKFFNESTQLQIAYIKGLSDGKLTTPEPQPVKQANWLTAARLVVEATPEQLPMAIDALRDLVEGAKP